MKKNIYSLMIKAFIEGRKIATCLQRMLQGKKGRRKQLIKENI